MFTQVKEYGQTALTWVLDFVYPPHCFHCDQPLNRTRRQTLCRSCLRHLARTRITRPFCRICGIPLSGQEKQGEEAQCLNCRMLRPPYDAARALFPYIGPAESLVRSYKYHGNHFLGPRIIKLAIELDWIPDSFTQHDCLVPVPLHPRRLTERGYNQATLISKVLSDHFATPIQSHAIKRKRHTDQQAQLTRPQRRENVRGAFASGKGDITGQRILLVDDVLTTGATAGACAQTLRRAGAEQVHVLTLVRACK